MSVNSLEAALYAVVMDRTVRAAFKTDPQEVLSGFPLSAAEKTDIAELNAFGLLEAGLNPMLLQGYWMVMRGPHALDELAALLNSRGGHG